jgi:ParB family chromosome partitioning protein
MKEAVGLVEEDISMKEHLPGDGWMARPFGRDVLYTKRTEKVSFEDLVPNPDQPREGRWENDELKREIEDAEGVFEPLLVEPYPAMEGKYLIIDGHRRWANVGRILKDLESHKSSYPSEDEWLHEYEKYHLLNIEVTHKPLSTPERLRVWVYIHRQREEWKLRERERTAHKLIEAVGTTAAAGILGISTNKLGRLVETYEYAKGLEAVLPDPDATITWAREIANLSPKYREPHVLDAVKQKIRGKLMINSKDVRALRQIVPHSGALAKFLEPESDVDEALALVPGARDPMRATRRHVAGAGTPYGSGLAADLRTFNDTLSNYSWIELVDARADPGLGDVIEEAEKNLRALKKAWEGKPAQ